MLKLADVASRPDMQLGPMLVSPSRRRVEGPAGTVHVEPRIMHVFLILLDEAGRVVTRNDLFDEVWGGAMVGDDSLNRAIAKVRRIAAETAPGFFEVETIPRTGYRLTGPILDHAARSTDGAQPVEQPRMSRRTLVAGAAAGIAALGAAGAALWTVRARQDRQFDLVLDRGLRALNVGHATSAAQQSLGQAVAMRPDHAGAHGACAYAHAMSGEYGVVADAGKALEQAERSARVALNLDPGEPYARLALTLTRRPTMDFAATEDSLREILATAPNNIEAMRHLWDMLQCVGRSREALALVERALAVAPLASGSHYPWAQLLWIVGRTGEADRVIDRASEYWPAHRSVRFAKFTILAFTGRPRAAGAMLERRETAPQGLSPSAIALWRKSLPAFDDPSPAKVAGARRANLEAASSDLRLARQAVLILSALGETDAAFEVANALFVVPGAAAPTAGAPTRSTAWRFAPWLFTPPTAALRADPRFDALCDGIGLTDYWAKRRVTPDYRLA